MVASQVFIHSFIYMSYDALSLDDRATAGLPSKQQSNPSVYRCIPYSYGCRNLERSISIEEVPIEYDAILACSEIGRKHIIYIMLLLMLCVIARSFGDIGGTTAVKLLVGLKSFLEPDISLLYCRLFLNHLPFQGSNCHFKRELEIWLLLEVQVDNSGKRNRCLMAIR